MMYKYYALCFQLDMPSQPEESLLSNGAPRYPININFNGNSEVIQINGSGQNTVIDRPGAEPPTLAMPDVQPTVEFPTDNAVATAAFRRQHQLNGDVPTIPMLEWHAANHDEASRVRDSSPPHASSIAASELAEESRPEQRRASGGGDKERSLQTQTSDGQTAGLKPNF
jgi:hypothetical protein